MHLQSLQQLAPAPVLGGGTAWRLLLAREFRELSGRQLTWTLQHGPSPVEVLGPGAPAVGLFSKNSL